MSILRGSGCVFQHFTYSCFNTPAMASRWAQEGPKTPQEGPKRLQENSKMPRGGPRAAKRGPRKAQDSPKMAPKTTHSRLQVAAFYYHLFKTPQEASRPLPDPPQGPPPAASGGTETPPRWAQEATRGAQARPRATKRLPGFSSGILSFSPERSWAFSSGMPGFSFDLSFSFQSFGSQSVELCGAGFHP